MIDLITAYRIVNHSILNVANDLVLINVLQEDTKEAQFRVKETPFNISGKRIRLGSVVQGHDLMQYTNRFYSISLNENERCLIDMLTDIDMDEIDIRGMGGSLCCFEG